MDEDTIAAVATAAGEGGIAIVRISGPGSLSVAVKVFRARSGAELANLGGYTVHYGDVTDERSGESLDDALLTVFRAPRSYTGEDVCEIACHGGSATTAIVLDLVLRAGARTALPGEFTQRAFLNGRMDLSQAEAVADLVRARTEAARRLARRQLEGDVSCAAAAIRDELIGIMAAIEVTIDFSDEVGELQYSEISQRLQRALLAVNRLLASAGKGRVMRDGLNVAIIGRPNVGKSTLLNSMLRSQRAIVTPIAGTTRDTIEESMAICGIPVVLTDTAGIRETDDPVERIGVERAKNVVISSDVVLLLLDAAAGITTEDTATANYIRNSCEIGSDGGESVKCIIVLNKRDLVSDAALDQLVRNSPSLLGMDRIRIIPVSAADGQGIDQVEAALVEPFMSDAAVAELSNADPIASVVVSNARHAHALEAARISLIHAAQSASDEMPGDFIALDVRGALDELGHISGETVTDDIIHRIFNDFCVGK